MSLQTSLHFIEHYINGITVYFLSVFTERNYFDIHLCYYNNQILFLLDNILLHGHTTVCLSIHLLLDIWVVSKVGSFKQAAMNSFV